MTDRITLPGTIPGLLRECSPVTIAVPEVTTGRGVIGQTYPPMLFGVWVRGEPSPLGRTRYGTAEVINQEWLSLDLDEPTGFLHALWWLRDHGGELAGLASCFSDMRHPPDWRHINQRIGHRFDDLFPDYAIWASAPLALQAVCLAAGDGR